MRGMWICMYICFYMCVAKYTYHIQDLSYDCVRFSSNIFQSPEGLFRIGLVMLLYASKGVFSYPRCFLLCSTLLPGNRFWLFREANLEPGYPLELTHYGHDIPYDRIDTAIWWEPSGYTYFFQGDW